MAMSPERYQELLSRLLEDELSDAEASEMAAALQENETLLRDLRSHLVLWDVWAQQQAPERSEAAFLRGWNTRRRAEAESADTFPNAVRTRLEIPPPGIVEAFKRFTRPRVRLVFATSCTIAAFALALWLGLLPPAQAVTTLKGEAVCTACSLHQSNEHAPAVRVMEAGSTHIYYLVRNVAVVGLQDYFCSGPAPVTTEGQWQTLGGRKWFEPRKVTIPAPSSQTNVTHTILPI